MAEIKLIHTEIDELRTTPHMSVEVFHYVIADTSKALVLNHNKKKAVKWCAVFI